MNRPSASHLPLALSALVASTSLAEADVITVCLDGSCDFTTIEDAVQASRDGDTIMIGPGIYYPSDVIVVNPSVATDFNLTLVGATTPEGEPATIIDAKGQRQILRANFYCYGSSVSNCIFTGGVASEGGAAYIPQETGFQFINCRFIGNTAVRGGGLYAGGGTYCLDCQFSDNTAQFGGGLFASGVSVGSARTLFVSNSASSDGGAVFIAGGEYGHYQCKVLGNFAHRGGGIYSSGRLLVAESIIESNLASNGGGLFTERAGIFSSECFVRDSIIRGNSVAKQGGGMYLDETATEFSNCLVTSNHAAIEGGGCVTTGGYLSAALTRFCGNLAPVHGQLDGTYFDQYANCVSDACEDCPIPGDIDLNGSVDGMDLAILLSAWGTNGAGRYSADVFRDPSGVVDGNDLAIVLSNWGSKR